MCVNVEKVSVNQVMLCVVNVEMSESHVETSAAQKKCANV